MSDDGMNAAEATLRAVKSIPFFVVIDSVMAEAEHSGEVAYRAAHTVAEEAGWDIDAQRRVAVRESRRVHTEVMEKIRSFLPTLGYNLADIDAYLIKAGYMRPLLDSAPTCDACQKDAHDGCTGYCGCDCPE